MPFAENSTLPEAVRNSLEESEQTRWRGAFNGALSGTCAGDDGCAARIAWGAVKKEARLIEGWASTDALDKQGDVVEPEAFRKTMDRYMAQGGLLIDRHSNRKIGAVIDWDFKKKGEKNGLWITAVVYRQYKVQDEVWEKIRQGKYEAFSIGADPLKIGRLCDEEKCWNTIKDLELFEISVVDRPANPEATIEAKTLAKGTESFLNRCTTSQRSPMELEGTPDSTSCGALKCLHAHFTSSGMPADKAQTEILKIVEKLKGGYTIDPKEEIKAGAQGAEAVVKEVPAPTPPTGGVDLNTIMTKLAEMDNRLKALEAGEAAEAEGVEGPKKPEEMKADILATPQAKAAMAEAVKAELVKMGAAKEATTPRPPLEKHDPNEKGELQKLLEDDKALGKMGFRELVKMTDGGR